MKLPIVRRGARAVASEGLSTVALRRAVLTLGRAYLRRTGSPTALSAIVNQLERQVSQRPDVTAAVRALIGAERLDVLDVGARGGPDPDFAAEPSPFRYFLVEADPEEAEALRRAGHVVVDRLLHDGPGRRRFNITRVPSKSSSLEPDGHVLAYYGAGRREQFDVVRSLELETTSIAMLAEQHAVQFDIVKLDTQGTELAILRGMGDQRPLVVKSEISLAEIYRDQDLFYELGRHLYDLGYLPYRLDMSATRTPRAATVADVPPSIGFPLHGDAFFVPDWTRPEGLEIIAGRDLRWAATLLLVGQEELLHHVVDAVDLPNGPRIVEVLRDLQAGGR